MSSLKLTMHNHDTNPKTAATHADRGAADRYRLETTHLDGVGDRK